MKILLLGSGAREHALARALARDPQTTELVVAPGNPGTAAIATNLNIDPSVPEEVVALATQMKADLVVVGTRGRGGLAGVLLGSTSQTVLGHSTCPVMIVPSAHLGEGTTAVHTEWERR